MIGHLEIHVMDESSQAICESSQVRSTPVSEHSLSVPGWDPLIFGCPHIVAAKSPDHKLIESV